MKISDHAFVLLQHCLPKRLITALVYRIAAAHLLLASAAFTALGLALMIMPGRKRALLIAP